jgi:hypothetical protein
MTIPAMAPPLRPDAALGLEAAAATTVGAVVGLALPMFVGLKVGLPVGGLSPFLLGENVGVGLAVGAAEGL